MVAFVAGTTLTAAALNSAFNDLTINAQSGAAYTLALTDAGGLVSLTATSGTATVTVPPNSSVAFNTGAQVGILAAGSATCQVSPGSGVTITSYGSATKLAGLGSLAVLVKTGTNSWYLAGGIVT